MHRLPGSSPTPGHGFRRIARAISGQTLVSLVVVALLLGVVSGCTRRFYRTWADAEVMSLLDEKNLYPAWELNDYYVYPNPIARYADWTDPDRPPMPPDDLPAWYLSTHPQKPKQVAYIEGMGYLNVLAAWDVENRAARKSNDEPKPAPPSERISAAIRPVECEVSTEPLAEEILVQPEESIDPQGQRLPVKVTISPAADETTAAGGMGFELPLCAQAAPGLAQRKEPFLINLDQSVELAVINSREYQNRREDLYLVALPVTLQRFNFAPQFDATARMFREWAGRLSSTGPRNRWELDQTGTGVGVQQLFSTGALLTMQLANRTVLEMTGNGRHTISESTLSLDLVQPLLQGGGRAVTLENLTQAERELVYELRSYARFHREFYVAIAAGRPFSGGGVGGFAGLNLGVAGQAAFVGYYPTVLNRVQLENNQQNVESFASLLRFYQAYAVGGAVSQLQVDQIEQNLLNAESSVLASQVAYADSLDQFKIQLGLPPNLPLDLDNAPLQPLRDQMRRLERVEAAYRSILERLEKLESGPEADAAELRAIVTGIIRDSDLVKGTRFQEDITRRMAIWYHLTAPADQVAGGVLDLTSAVSGGPSGPGSLLLGFALIPRRSPALVRLQSLYAELLKLEEEADRFETAEQAVPQALQESIADVRLEIDLGNLELALRTYEGKPWEREPLPERRRLLRADLFRRVTGRFAQVLEGARNERLTALETRWPKLPGVYLRGVNLLEIDELEAQNLIGQTALVNRLDLMNARASVVDAWRQIAVFANDLLGVLNLRYHMDVITPRGLAQPLLFEGYRSRHQLTVDGSLPLVRVLERNQYRAALIAYQRQRRALMQQEDQVLFQVRNELRQLKRAAENYKIQQRALQLAYQQVDNALEALRAPPAPNEARDAATAAAALTQQLVNAQTSVPQAQNRLFQAWVDYVTTRMALYRDLELLRVDSRGVWIDEFTSVQPDTSTGVPAAYP